MAKEKSLVEEAIIQMKNLEEAVAENAKGILASTMKQEIKDLVKESLSEQADDEVETDDVEVKGPKGSEDIADITFDDDTEDDGNEMDTDDMDDTEEDGDDEEDMDFDDEEDMDDEDDTIDLTDADDEEVLRVFQLMGPDDNIVVTKDDKGNTHLKDEETGKEYMIVGEGEEEEMDESDEEEMDESIESIVERMFSSDDDMDDEDEDEMDFEEFDEDWGENSHDFKRHNGHKIGDVDGHYKDYEFDEDEDMDGETIYEIEMDDEDDDEEEMDESIYESESKMSIKPRAMGIGSEKTFKYPKHPSNGDGFTTPTKLKHASEAKPTRFHKTPGLEYKGGKSIGHPLAKSNNIKKVESKEQYTVKPKTGVKKAETKEAARTLGNGSNFRKGGLPKPFAHSKFNANIKESSSNKELQILREKNEEYRKALNVFRSKLNEVAVFNSNLAYATRLFTEHSTSKQEKINILRRFDSVETIKESKNLYQVVKNELSGNSKSQPMNESLERKIAKAPSTGSAINLIESKTYENPQFLRMKDLMTKIK
jgi:hypothetical protein